MALLATACGSSSKSSSSTDNTTAGTTGKTSGAPVRLFVTGVQDNVQDLIDGAKVAAKAVNDAGGIKGHPIEIKTCGYPQTAPTNSDQCVRGAIADTSELALIGSNVNSPDVDPMLEQAHMASVGGFLGYANDFTSPAILAVQGGSALQSLAQALACTQFPNVKKIAVPHLDVPPGVAARDLVSQFVVKPKNLQMTAVPIPITATDMTPQANAVLNSDCVAVVAFGPWATGVAKGALSAGYTKPIVQAGASYSPESIAKNFGTDAKNIYVANMFNYGSDGYKTFLKEAKAFDSSIVPRLNDFSAQAWLAVHLTADTANKVAGTDVPSRDTMWTELHKITAYDTHGLTTSPLNFTVKGTALGGSIPNMFPSITGMWVTHYQDGTLKPVGSNQELKLP